MKFESFEQVQHIGQIIRSVAKAQSQRFFKSDRNTAARALLVFHLIEDEANLALYEGGFADLLTDIDATEIILEQMAQDDYNISLASRLLHQEREPAWEDRPCW